MLAGCLAGGGAVPLDDQNQRVTKTYQTTTKTTNKLLDVEKTLSMNTV